MSLRRLSASELTRFARKNGRKYYLRRMVIAVTIFAITALLLFNRGQTVQTQFKTLKSARFAPNPSDESSSAFFQEHLANLSPQGMGYFDFATYTAGPVLEMEDNSPLNDDDNDDNVAQLPYDERDFGDALQDATKKQAVPAQRVRLQNAAVQAVKEPRLKKTVPGLGIVQNGVAGEEVMGHTSDADGAHATELNVSPDTITAVIVQTSERDDKVRDTVNALLAQSLPVKEIIVARVRARQQFCNQITWDPARQSRIPVRFICVLGENGRDRALNAAAALATGKYITVVEPASTLVRHSLSSALATLRKAGEGQTGTSNIALFRRQFWRSLSDLVATGKAAVSGALRHADVIENTEDFNKKPLMPGSVDEYVYVDKPLINQYKDSLAGVKAYEWDPSSAVECPQGAITVIVTSLRNVGAAVKADKRCHVALVTDNLADALLLNADAARQADVIITSSPVATRVGLLLNSNTYLVKSPSSALELIMTSARDWHSTGRSTGLCASQVASRRNYPVLVGPLAVGKRHNIAIVVGNCNVAQADSGSVIPRLLEALAKQGVQFTIVSHGHDDASCQALKGMGYAVHTNAYKSGESFSELLSYMNLDLLLVHGILPGLQEAREAGMHSVQLLPTSHAADPGEKAPTSQLMSSIALAATAIVVDSDSSAHSYLGKGIVPAGKLVVLQSTDANRRLTQQAMPDLANNEEEPAEPLEALTGDVDDVSAAEMGTRPNNAAVLATAKRPTAQMGHRPGKAAVMDLVDKAPAFMSARNGEDSQSHVRRDSGNAISASGDDMMLAHKLVQLIGWISQNGSPATFNAFLNSC